MGDRYFVEEACLACGAHQTVMYAETCNMTEWTCHACGQEHTMTLHVKSSLKHPKKGAE